MDHTGITHKSGRFSPRLEQLILGEDVTFRQCCDQSTSVKALFPRKDSTNPVRWLTEITGFITKHVFKVKSPSHCRWQHHPDEVCSRQVYRFPNFAPGSLTKVKSQSEGTPWRKPRETKPAWIKSTKQHYYFVLTNNGTSRWTVAKPIKHLTPWICFHH